jgi:small conductance mechanosensitive channel
MIRWAGTALESGGAGLTAQIPIDPNGFIDPTGVGWQEGVAAAATLAIAFLAASLAGRFLTRAARRWPNLGSPVVVMLVRLVRWTIVLLGIAFALLLVGFEVGPIFLIITIVIAVFVVMGRPLLENFGASVVLQAETPFRVGDLVEIVGTTGVINEVSGRTTVIDTFDGKRLRIPNNQVLNSSIANLSERRARRSEIKVGVEYGTDLDRARAVILETVGQAGGVFAEPAPEALVNDFGDSAITFIVWFWHEPAINGSYRVIDRVARAVDRAFRSEGIVIAFPQRVVWSKPGSAPDTTNRDSDETSHT